MQRPDPSREHDRLPAAAPRWLARAWHSPWPGLALVILFCCVPLFIGLGRTDLDNDEALYSFSVETMVAHGDWLTPRLLPDGAAPFLEKPPLKFWITAAPIWLGWLPDNEFGLRFMDALMGSLAFLYVFLIGRMLGGPVSGLAAALLLFTHDQLVFQHGLRTNNMEAAVVLAYCGGLYHFLAWRSPNPDVKRHIVAMGLYFVLGFMAKFVAALFLPLIAGLAALLTRADRARAYRDWRTFAWVTLLAGALIVPWFVYQYLTHPDLFVDKIFGQHVYQRLTGVLDPAHLQPWSHYFIELWRELRAAGTIVITIAGAGFLLTRVIRRRWVEGAVVVLWFVIPTAVVSAGTSKLYHYAYPFLPPVAIAGGYFIATVGGWAWRRLDRGAAAFAKWRHRWMPRVFAGPAFSALASAIAMAGILVAAATFAFGRLQVGAGSATLRNSSVLRPAAAGLAVAAMGAPSAMVRGLVVAGLLTPAMPLEAYQRQVQRTHESQTKLRDVRDCLRARVDDPARSGLPAPGVWVEAPATLPHTFPYYLRGLGPWQHRDFGSDGTVVMHLIAPGRHRPVMLSRERYGEVITRFAEAPDALIDRVARMTDLAPAVLDESRRSTIIGIVEFRQEVLLLPGPFSGCGDVRARLIAGDRP
jgi:4-amino-4-deoxy-L-arabinose transferase-like glycosyltransferase